MGGPNRQLECYLALQLTDYSYLCIYPKWLVSTHDWSSSTGSVLHLSCLNSSKSTATWSKPYPFRTSATLIECFQDVLVILFQVLSELFFLFPIFENAFQLFGLTKSVNSKIVLDFSSSTLRISLMSSVIRILPYWIIYELRYGIKMKW